MNTLAKYSDKQLKTYRIIILTIGIINCVLSILLLSESVFLGLLFLIPSLIGLKIAKAYKIELKFRASKQAQMSPEEINITSDISLSDSEFSSAEEIAIPATPVKKNVTEHYNIVGTSYRQKAIKELGIENLDYGMSKTDIIEFGMCDEKIYQLSFFPESVVLEEEPDNEHDPNAIKLLIDNIHVGYIKRSDCSHIKQLIKDNQIDSISANIFGGKYKIVNWDYDCAKDKDSYELEKDETDFFVSIDIVLR